MRSRAAGSTTPAGGTSSAMADREAAPAALDSADSKSLFTLRRPPMLAR